MKASVPRWSPFAAAAIAFCAAAVLLVQGAPCQASEAEILQQLNQLRGVQPTTDSNKLAAVNARLDAAWKFLLAHQNESAPIIQLELTGALAAQPADQLFILDTAHLLLSFDQQRHAALALKALAKLDPNADILRYNLRELFNFTYAVAQTGQPDVLAQIDRLFLLNTNRLVFFDAPHYVDLAPTELCAFLYGITGTNAEDHLLSVIENNKAARLRALEVLCWVGSERCIPRVKAVLEASRDYETFSHAATFLTDLGGPAGRDAVLQASPTPLDARTRTYLNRILPIVKGRSADTLKASLKELGGTLDQTITDAQLKAALKKMHDNYGADNETNPYALLTSKLPRPFLLEQLKSIRTRTFYRLTNRALEDVQVTNLLINALQFAGS